MTSTGCLSADPRPSGYAFGKGVGMRALFPWVLIVLCPPALADLYTAHLAYQQGDFVRAFADFRDLAELGQPLAQYSLAVMYSKGQGTRQSELNAYAWATLAAENGEARGRALADELRPMLAPGSERIAEDIRAPYTRATLDVKLMPQAPPDDGVDRRCWALKQVIPEYPEDAQRLGMDGEVYVEWTVSADGSARHPRVAYAVPPNKFESAVQSAVLHTRYPAANPSAPAAHCSQMYRFIQGRGAENLRLQQYVKETRVKADNGDVGAQVLYGMLLGLPQLQHKPQDGLPWFLKAAQAGSHLAQFEVGNALMSGWGCQCDDHKGLVWLRRAAEADEPNAQVALAGYALRGNPDAASTRKAAIWLERAAAHQDPYGMLYLSALLAATPVAELRDSKRALQLVDGAHSLRGDPTPFEIRAAAQAASADFAAAVRNEREAIALATKLQWDLAPLDERLVRYESRQPWYGDLLAF